MRAIARDGEAAEAAEAQQRRGNLRWSSPGSRPGRTRRWRWHTRSTGSRSCSAPPCRASRTRGRTDSSRRADRGWPAISAGPISRRPERLERLEVLLDVFAQRPGVLVAELGFEREGVLLDVDRVRGTHVEAQESERRQIARAQHAVEAALLPRLGRESSARCQWRGRHHAATPASLFFIDDSISPARQDLPAEARLDNRNAPLDVRRCIDAGRCYEPLCKIHKRTFRLAHKAACRSQIRHSGAFLFRR